jgi:hypothetical protein
MKVRITVPGTRLSARLTALCWGALTLLAPVAVSACSGGGSSSPSVPTFSPSVTISPTVTHTGTGPASGGTTTPGSGVTTTPASGGTTTPASGGTTSPGTPGVASSAPPTHTATAIATATVTVTATATSGVVPTAAPVTGGGGTAGLQDGLLLSLGAAAILAGVGSIIYRRRLTRHR